MEVLPSAQSVEDSDSGCSERVPDMSERVDLLDDMSRFKFGKANSTDNGLVNAVLTRNTTTRARMARSQCRSVLALCQYASYLRCTWFSIDQRIKHTPGRQPSRSSGLRPERAMADRGRRMGVSLDALIEAEQDIVKVYFKKIDDSLLNWRAVEEDFIESYTRLIETTSNQEVRDVLCKIVDDSKNHIRKLKGIAELMESIIDDEVKHRMTLLALRDQN